MWSINDFGGCPDDDCDDHEAFQAAAAYFNDRGGNGTLNIPAGHYIVGYQGPGAAFGANNYTLYDRLMYFVGCEDLNIIGAVDANGEPASWLEYKECLLYGAFDPASPISDPARYIKQTGVNFSPNTVPSDNAYAANIGAAILLRNCDDVTIQDLDLDGNSDKLILGGGYPIDDGRQLEHDGIWVGINTASTNVTIDNVHAHHFGRDGLILQGSNPAMGLTIQNSSFDWNGRQGFSWVSGRGVTCNNSTFNYNSVGRVRSAPGAGLDLEDEASGDIGDGVFTDCEFAHNRLRGIIAGHFVDPDNPQVHPITLNLGPFTFTNCTIKAGQADWYGAPQGAIGSQTVNIDYPNVSFDQCDLYGSSVNVFDAFSNDCNTPPAGGTVFSACNFLEEDGQFSYVNPVGNCINSSFARHALLHWEHKSGVILENCTIVSNCNARLAALNGRADPAGMQCSNDCLHSLNTIQVIGSTSMKSHGAIASYGTDSRGLIQRNYVSVTGSHEVAWPDRIRSRPSSTYNGVVGTNLLCVSGTAVTSFDPPAFSNYPCLPSYLNPPVTDWVPATAANGPIIEPVQMEWYLDLDGDGFGDPNEAFNYCARPDCYVANNFDCDDQDEMLHPGTPCDDGDMYTINDAYDESCNCVGELVGLTTTHDPEVSCGTTKAQFGFTWIHAQEVPGANRYQFRFVNTQLGYDRMIAKPTRSFLLNQWATYPLQINKIYDVTVRTSFDGGATYGPWGPVCTFKMGGLQPPAGVVITGFSQTEICRGEPFQVDFDTWGTFQAGDQFIVELSDINGLFHPVPNDPCCNNIPCGPCPAPNQATACPPPARNINVMGAPVAVPSGMSNGSITAVIVNGTGLQSCRPNGTGYRIRIHNTDQNQPPIFSPSSPLDITIDNPPSWYLDCDGDGYGDPGLPRAGCTQPSPTAQDCPGVYVMDNTDCDDSDPMVHAGSSAPDDGDPYTIDEVYDVYCNSQGRYPQLTEPSCSNWDMEIGGSTTLTSETVPGANRYQWRFTALPSYSTTYARLIARPTEDLWLGNWTTAPLTPGWAYCVQVRVSFNNGVDYGPWGPCCKVRVRPNYPGTRYASGEHVENTQHQVLLWPNPNDGSQLNIFLAEGLVLSESVSIKLFNVKGKEVYTKDIRNLEGERNLRIELPNELAAGLFMVNVNTGEHNSTHRLVLE